MATEDEFAMVPEPLGNTKAHPTFKSVAQMVSFTIRTRRSTYPHVDEHGKINLRTKLLYALPQFSVTSLTMLIGIHATLFYESLGAPLAFIAFFTAVARSFDVLTDPLMAWISDNTRLAMGRRKPYIRYFAAGYSIMFVFFMSPPETPEDYGFTIAGWFGTFNLLFYVFDTVANVPYSALGPELTDDYAERSSLFFYQKFIGAFGTLLGAAGPALLQTVVSRRASFSILSIIFGVYFIFFTQLLSRNITERQESLKTEQVPLVPSILRSFKNRAFRPLLVGWVLDFIALSGLATMLPFFIRFVVRPTEFEAENLLAVCLGALLLSGLLAMPMWLYMTKLIGKRNTWLAYNLVNSTTCALFFFVGRDDVTLLILVVIANGIPTGGQFLIDSILADVIDYDEFLNGTRSEGGFTVFATFIPKVASIPAQAIPLAIISAVGFRPSINGVDQEQTERVQDFIRLVFIAVPSLCTVASFLIKLSFPIKTRTIVEQISAGIAAHMRMDPFPDPLTGRTVSLLHLKDEELKQSWVLDNFSVSALERLAAGEPPSFIVSDMRQLIAIGFLNLASFVFLLQATLKLLASQSLAWIPAFSVMICGMSFVFIAFSFMRLRSAHQVVQNPPQLDLILRILDHKGKGQRGGDPVRRRDLRERENSMLVRAQHLLDQMHLLPHLPGHEGSSSELLKGHDHQPSSEPVMKQPTASEDKEFLAMQMSEMGVSQKSTTAYNSPEDAAAAKAAFEKERAAFAAAAAQAEKEEKELAMAAATVPTASAGHGSDDDDVEATPLTQKSASASSLSVPKGDEEGGKRFSQSLRRASSKPLPGPPRHAELDEKKKRKSKNKDKDE